jgi:arylsulfatase A-like enzyme
LYDSAILYTDKMMGNIIRKLKDIEIYDTSWIIITSDHGEGLGELHDDGNRTSWRHGPRIYNDQIRIPLIIKPPQKIMNRYKGKKVIKDPVQLVDLPPTLLAMIGENAPPQFVGKNILALMENEKQNTNSYVYAENINRRHFSIVNGEFKLIMTPPSYLFVQEDKYRFQFYNLKDDPKEENNVIKNKKFSNYSGIYTDMKNKITKHASQIYSQDTENGINKKIENKIIEKKNKKIDAKQLKRLKELGYL